MDINTITRLGGRTLLRLQKHSPEILTGLGIVGGIASGVMASKATLKVEEIVDESKQYLEVAKKDTANDPGAYNKQAAYVYTRTALRLGRLYGPAISLGLASVTCILSAHGIMRKRNAALLGAYKVVEQAFSEYRARVEEEVGPEKERELYYATRKEIVEDAELTNKPPHDKKQPVGALSIYAKCFDETNPNFVGNPEYNLYFLRARQNYVNDMLKVRGHMFLNDVYDQLGIPRTKAGSVVGWVRGNGDDFIDFGVYDKNRPMAMEFINGNENAIWLDFNVDGVVYDLLED